MIRKPSPTITADTLQARFANNLGIMGCPYCFAYVLDIKAGWDRNSAWLSQNLPLKSEGLPRADTQRHPIDHEDHQVVAARRYRASDLFPSSTMCPSPLTPHNVLSPT